MTVVKRRKDFMKRVKPDPAQRAIKYICNAGHIRIEKEALGRPLPICPACEKEGKSNRFRYVGKYTIPKNQLKKSKF